MKSEEVRSKNRQALKRACRFLVEPRGIEVPQAALRARDVPTRSPLAGQPLGDDMGFDSPTLQTQKGPPFMGGPFAFGGAEGNRTPVRKHFKRNFSGRRRLFWESYSLFPSALSTVKRTHQVASLFMVSSKLCLLTSAFSRRPTSGPRHSRRGRVTA